MSNSILRREDFKGNFISKLVKGQHGRHGDLSRYYFGQNTKDNALSYSLYKPSNSSENNNYIAINLPAFKDKIIDAYFNHPEYFIDDSHYNGNFYESFVSKNHHLNNYGLNNLGTFKLQKSRDNKGDYLSYYDIWDTDPKSTGKANMKTEHFGAGKPFEIYDRIYLDDYYKIPENKRGGYYIPEINVTANKKKLGGKPKYSFTLKDFI